MAAPRKAPKGRSSTLKLAFWAVVMTLVGLTMGLLLSRSSCEPKVHHRVEPRERAPKPRISPPKAQEPDAPAPEPVMQEPEPEPRKPEKPLKKTETPELPEKPAKIIKPEPQAKPEPPPKPEKVVKIEKQVPPKPPEKQPTKPAKVEKAQVSETRPQSTLPKLALLIDDLGYAQLDLVKRLCQEPVAFSVAVLPYQEFTRESADTAYSMGKEVMLHMPMEPIGYPGPGKDPGPSAVLFDLKESEIRARVRSAMDAVPHRTGVNNHMGSRITPDRPRMTWILQEIKSRHYFFVDSRTEKDSVAFDVARELKIPTVQRKVFLDDDKSFAEMAKQWERAIEIAHKEGEVLIIGHIYPETVEALEKLIPKAKGRVQFVKAGAMVK